jgi:thioredoxin-related protein
MRFLILIFLLIIIFYCASRSENESSISIVISDFEELNLSSKKHFFEEIINPSSLALQVIE